MEKINRNPALAALMERAWECRVRNFPNTIQFDIPTDTKQVSVTGSECGLSCAHCGGHYLKHMTPIEAFASAGIKSCLVSGGCNSKGAVDFHGKMDEIKRIKASGCKINMHVGLVNDDIIEQIRHVADYISFDFLVDDETIREVYRIDRTGQDYIETYSKLRRVVKVIPHICIGLKGGEVKGEFDALSELGKIGMQKLVFIVFTPTPGTGYSKKNPPLTEKILEVVAFARVKFPDISIHLGCMRPKGGLRAEIDYYSILCGVNKIVNPTRPAVEKARQLGLNAIYGRECCVL